jgi:hypothetical protein
MTTGKLPQTAARRRGDPHHLVGSRRVRQAIEARRSLGEGRGTPPLAVNPLKQTRKRAY